jgi:imidazolonepropionase-like amidohydrolase
MLAYQDLLDAGLMIGSRIRSTGPALFSFNEFKSKAEVDAVLERYAQHYRLSNVKLYRTGNRQVRQWIAQSAREHQLMVTTEGAGSTQLDLTHIQDGFAGAEHALPAAPLYRDVIELMARSGVSYNTTLMVSSEASAQDYFIVEKHPNADAKLNRFSPRFIVDMKTRMRTWRPLEDYPFPAYAESAARLVRAGGLVGMGSHGEVPGLGFHWEMEGHVIGGMTRTETLYAATMGSARAIGREADFGSIERGKIADLIVLDRDPLADIRNTLAIAAVMKGGRLYDGETLDELWPTTHRFPELWYRSDKPPGTPGPVEPVPPAH